MYKSIKIEKFTAFEHLEINFSSGINVFIGANGTGKTHVLKLIYAASDITRSKKGLAEKINKVFLPSKEQIGRLVKRSAKSSKGFVEWVREERLEEVKIRLSMTSHTKEPDKATLSGAHKRWTEFPVESVYIPVKDMMANAPGFRALYSQRHIHFEEVYPDIIDRVFVPPLKGPPDPDRKRILTLLQEAMDGKVITKNEEFFLKNKQGELEFTLLAEGIRKLALLWVLIQNGTLLRGSILCWDEPETNLNPRLMKTVISILIELQRMGVQVFLSTHDYVILKEFDLQTEAQDNVMYHAFSRNEEDNEIRVNTTQDYLAISPNAIDDTFGDLATREIQRSMA
ncbi:Putative ATP-binding protein [hydrothermal vent metagenome]|uniref:ATP-binding protein n=1 Tax=hydrothermal vent metagenome TaxID=652676 RepID=A0A3B0VUD6_9ZZZZ